MPCPRFPLGFFSIVSTALPHDSFSCVLGNRQARFFCGRAELSVFVLCQPMPKHHAASFPCWLWRPTAFHVFIVPHKLWLSIQKQKRKPQPLRDSTNFSTSRRSNRIGPLSFSRTQRSCPSCTRVLTVPLQTARSFDTSEMLSKGVTA